MEQEQFSLAFAEQLAELSPAQQRRQILATNGAAFSQYGVSLTPDEAAMIAAAGREAAAAEQLVLLDEGITPRLIHWFLPSGYLGGANYAATVASLTEAFYRIRGGLQSLCDSAGDPGCMLSDNAILDYMYQFYVSPGCAGDIGEMLRCVQRLIVPAMYRLIAKRAKSRSKQRQAQGDPVQALLYADLLAAEQAESALEEQAEEEAYDYAYRAGVRRDCFGNFEADYDFDYAEQTRGTFTEELAEALQRNPEFLIPSAEKEAEWADQAERWAEEDARAAGEEDAQ